MVCLSLLAHSNARFLAFRMRSFISSLAGEEKKEEAEDAVEEVKASPSPSPSEGEESESQDPVDEVEEELAGEQIQDRQTDDIKFDGMCAVHFLCLFPSTDCAIRCSMKQQRRALWCRRD